MLLTLRSRVRSGHALLAAALTTALVASSACDVGKMHKEEAAGLIRQSSPFKTGKLAYVPRVVSIPAELIVGSAASREGEALNLIQIASIDPVVAVLRARDEVEIEDFVSAVPGSVVMPKPPKPDSADSAKAAAKKDSTKSDSTKSDSAGVKQDSTIRKPTPPPLNRPMTSPPPAPPLAQQWVHTLRLTPRARPEMSDLVIDDGSYNEDAPRPTYNDRAVGRIPGWTLPLANRELIRVLAVGGRGSAREAGQDGFWVDFLWRWRSTRAGELFDAEGAEFQSLPTELQQAARNGGLILDTSTPVWSRATFVRGEKGWRVATVDWGYGDGKPHEPW